MGFRIRIVQGTFTFAALLIACGCATSGVSSSPSGRSVPGADPSKGHEAIVQYGCGACHVIPGVAGANGSVGPSLGGLSERQLIAGRLPNTAGDLEHWIQDPQGVSPGTAMPYMGVTDTDAANIAAYLYEQR